MEDMEKDQNFIKSEMELDCGGGEHNLNVQ